VQDFCISTYRIKLGERGEREVAFSRSNLKILDGLKMEAERTIKVGLHNGNQKSAFIECPNEILEEILTYVADGCINCRKEKIKNIAAGNKFYTDPQLNRRQASNLAGVAKSCRQLRLISQYILYRVVCLDNFTAIRSFVSTVCADSVIGKMAHAVYINVDQTRTRKSSRTRNLLWYKQDDGGVVVHLDLASMFVALVESCPEFRCFQSRCLET
jgi:hypothetical protein